MDNTENVELLSFVLVYTLDLDIEECLGIYTDPCSVFDMLGQSHFVGMFNLLPLLLKVRIVNVIL